MELTYGQLETSLRAHLTIHPDKALTLRSRLKQLQRLPVPFPPGVNIGRGTRMLYTTEHLFQLVTAFELLSMGIPAQPACQIVLTHWNRFAAGYALAALQDRRSGDGHDEIFAIVDVRSMNNIQFGWAKNKASEVDICDESSVLRLLRVSEFRRGFSKLTINLSALVKGITKIARDTAGVSGAGTWSEDFHPWLPADEAHWIQFSSYYPDRSNLKIRKRLHRWHGNDPDSDTPEGEEEARAFIEDNFGALPF